MTASRRWLALGAAVLAIASLLPPAATYARQYVFAEALQFAVFAIVTPALLVLGAPWRLLRVSRRQPAQGAQPTGSGAAPVHQKPGGASSAGRLALTWRRPAIRAGGFLLLFAGVSVAWRLPVTVDALARQGALTVLELVTLAAAGTAFWLELVESPPHAPRLTHLQRAVFATLAMWITWVHAYVLGFSHVAWFHAYAHAAGTGMSAVADQEIATGTLWAVAALSFIPVIFASMVVWLTDTEDPDDELRTVVRPRIAAVRGWGNQSRS